MSEPRRFGSGDLILLLIILAASVAARTWYLRVCADGAQKEGPLQAQDPDATQLNALVQNLKDQHQFACRAPLAGAEEVTAHRAPGYAMLLAGLEMTRIDAGSIGRIVRWTQMGLGTLTAAFYFFFALRAFGSRLVAALTGLLCAFHPFWVINTAEINDGVLTTFLLAACLLLGARGGQSGGAFGSLLYGLLLAGLALVRAALLPFAVVAVLWFVLRSRHVRSGWLCALLAVLGFAIGLTFWTVRNYKELGDLVPIADSTYLHLWAGNNSKATGGPQTEETMLQALAETQGADAKATTKQWADLKQPERYGKLGGEVWKQVRNDPEGALKHRLEAGLSFFVGNGWLRDRNLKRMQTSESTDMPQWLSGSYSAIFYGSLLILLVLGLLGWRWTYAWHREAMPSSLALLWIPLPYFLSHAEDLYGPRLPLDGLLLCHGAFAVACLVPVVARQLFHGDESRREREERFLPGGGGRYGLR